MKKQEVLKHIRKKMGFIPYVGIFDIYNDDDDIPQGLIDISIKPIKPRENFIICSSLLAESLSKII